MAKFFRVNVSFFTGDTVENKKESNINPTLGINKGGDRSPMSAETAEKILLEIIKINEKVVSLNERFAGLENRMTTVERALKEQNLTELEKETTIRKRSAS